MNERDERIHSIMHLVISSTFKHRKIMDFHLEETGVFSAQHQLLMEITKNPLSSQKDIADRLKISTAAVAVSLKKLEKGGYIVREMDSDDNRLNQVTLTDKGKKVVAISRETFRKVDHSIFEDFSDDDLSMLFQLMQKLNTNIKTKEEEIKQKKGTNRYDTSGNDTNRTKE